MKFLITGGNGFIGSHLTMRLLSQGHEVVVLDNFSTSPRSRLDNTGAVVIEGSVTDEKLVEQLVEGCDYVIHLAAVVGVRLSMAKGIEGLRVSCIGTDNVLKAVTKYHKKLLAASSSSVYGKITKVPVNETEDSLIGCSSKPCWLYSTAKLAEEHFCLAYHREMGTHIKICRFFNVIGPNQTKHYGMVIPNFVSNSLKNIPLQVYGTGMQTRTFGYIEDIIDGVLIVIEKGLEGEIYNIGGTEEIRIMDLASKVIKLAKSSSGIEMVPFEKIYGKNFEETIQRMPDITKIRGLGYSPKYSLDASILRIIDYIRLRGEI
jgi:UDP-glucose 4-epimerase